VLALHGWLGRGADWAPVAARLPVCVLAPDLPGHGASSVAPVSMDETADALVALLDEQGIARAVVAGYSMGGRLALHLALRHPDRVAGLLLVAASAGLPEEGERAARRALDAERAAALRADPDGFLERWYAMPLFDPLDAAARARLAADRRAHGNPEGWARALTAFSTGAQPWLGDRLHEIRVPTVALAGSADAKFAALARRMATAGPLTAEVVPGAGHALLAERPDAVAAALARLLASAS
jgi:2-succinyl-6-hydroxy-2,4-cyclohexadiene-1-carboxylate synthase